MIDVDIELVADVFVDFPVLKQRVGSCKRVGLRECLGIFESDFDLKVSQVGPAVAFDHMKLIAVRNSLAVQPGLVIETDRVHNKSVAVPLCNRVSHPQRIKIFGVPATVQKELPIAMHISFIENDDERGRLNKFLRKWRNTRDTGGKAMTFTPGYR